MTMGFHMPAAPRVLTQLDLEVERCADPSCEHHQEQPGDPAFLSPVCHQGAPMVVAYQRGHGVLHLFCFVCESYVNTIAVGAP